MKTVDQLQDNRIKQIIYENKVFLCDYASGAVVNYSFNESDLIQVKE